MRKTIKQNTRNFELSSETRNVTIEGCFIRLRLFDTIRGTHSFLLPSVDSANPNGLQRIANKIADGETFSLDEENILKFQEHINACMKVAQDYEQKNHIKRDSTGKLHIWEKGSLPPAEFADIQESSAKTTGRRRIRTGP